LLFFQSTYEQAFHGKSNEAPKVFEGTGFAALFVAFFLIAATICPATLATSPVCAASGWS
jgi:hypothetical protein